MTLPAMSAFEPELVASVSPHPEHLISDVVCENMTALAPHFSHWTEIKLLRGFGTRMFSLFMTIIRSPACVSCVLPSWSFSGKSCMYSVK